MAELKNTNVLEEHFNELIAMSLSGDKNAREMIINENVGLIWSIVRKFSGRGVEIEDLFQIGCIGLIKAIDKFDMSFNVKFSTYAVPMIMGEIKRYLRDDGIIKVSRSLKELANKAHIIKEVLTKKNGYEPSVKEIAIETGVTPEELSVALEATAKPESLYSSFEGEKGDNKALIDRIESPDMFEKKVMNKLLIEKLINDYPERERKIIFLRYFRSKTQTQVAKQLGISQVQVSRIEKKILLDMKNKITEK